MLPLKVIRFRDPAGMRTMGGMACDVRDRISLYVSSSSALEPTEMVSQQGNACEGWPMHIADHGYSGPCMIRV